MKPKRPTNDRVARGIDKSEPTSASWDTFDSLPRQVRAALWEAPVPINLTDTEEFIDEFGVDALVVALVDAIMQEVRLFAAQHQRRTGYELPHVAAEVSMQRYEVRRSATRRHRRYRVGMRNPTNRLEA